LHAEWCTFLSGEPAADVGAPRFEGSGRALIEHRKVPKTLVRQASATRFAGDDEYRRHQRAFEMSA
jgi:hypothetical protein